MCLNREERTVRNKAWIIHKKNVTIKQCLCICMFYNIPMRKFSFRSSSILCVPIYATAYRLRNIVRTPNSNIYCKFTEIHNKLI